MSLVHQPTLQSRTSSPARSLSPAPSSNASPPKRTRLYELDLLRLIAAIAVVLFHYTFVAQRVGVPAVASDGVGEVTRYGHLGVQFFFMLSGFVILLGDTTRPATTYLRDRVVRLYPTYWLAVAITGAVVLLSEPERWWEVLVNATMLQDGVAVRPLDGSYWSLFVELKFYLLIAVVLHTRQMHRMDSILAGWAFITAVDMAISTSEIVHSMLLLRYSPFFIAGAVLAVMHRDGEWRPHRIAVLLSCWLMAVVKVPAEVYALEVAWKTEFSSAVTVAALTGFFVLMTAAARGSLIRLRKPSFAILGAMSYPLYVLHQELAYQIFRQASDSLALIGVAVFIAMLAASYVVAKWIEPRLARQLRAALSGQRSS